MREKSERPFRSLRPKLPSTWPTLSRTNMGKFTKASHSKKEGYCMYKFVVLKANISPLINDHPIFGWVHQYKSSGHITCMYVIVHKHIHSTYAVQVAQWVKTKWLKKEWEYVRMGENEHTSKKRKRLRILLFRPKKSAENMRKSSRRNFATKVCKSIKFNDFWQKINGIHLSKAHYHN